MESGAEAFDRLFDFLKALIPGGVRYLVIGRQACILHGLPVATFDYDLWVAPDPTNLDALLRVAEPRDFFPTRPRDQLASVPFFRLENDTRIDVWKVREFVLSTGERLTFSEAYQRRKEARDDANGLRVPIPDIEDLIFLKRMGGRTKDLEDIRALTVLLEQRRREGP